MAATLLDSLIVAQALQDAWARASSGFNGDPVRIAEFLNKTLVELANRTALQRSLAAQLDKESSPEALQHRVDMELRQREAREKASKVNSARMVDLAVETETARRTANDGRLADMKRNGVRTAGM
jgi:hypothetical protein